MRKSPKKDVEIKCSICGQYVLTNSELGAHIMKCHDKQHNCNECDFQATTQPMLIKHKKTENTIPRKTRRRGRFNVNIVKNNLVPIGT